MNHVSANRAARSAAAWVASRIYVPSQRILGSRIWPSGFIAAYHDLPAARFEAQVEALAPNQPVHLSELLERLQRGQATAGLFALTFDDGVAATVKDISAVCVRRHWPVTFYLPTAYLDERIGMPFQWWRKLLPHLPRKTIVLAPLSPPIDLGTDEARAHFFKHMQHIIHEKPRQEYAPLIEELRRYVVAGGLVSEQALAPPAPIPWAEVRELARTDEIRFESHGITHTAVSALSEVELDHELRASKERISGQTGRECRHFCYPYGEPGSIGKKAPGVVSQIYDSGVTMARGRIRGSSPALVPRVPFYGEDDENIVRLKVLTV